MAEIFDEIAALARKRNDLTLESHSLEYQRGRYPFLRIASKEIHPEDRVMMLTAGIHGEEISGPLTIARYFNEIVDYVQNSGLKLIMYPVRNPSGVSIGTKRNVDDDDGLVGSNDCIWYVHPSGELTDEIGEGQDYLRWEWADDVVTTLPLEARCFLKCLRRDPLEQVAAGIDMHQDYSEGLPPCAYHYAFGDLERYALIVKKIAQKVPLWKNKIVSAGYSSGVGKPTDENGFVVRNDGTVLDLWYRMGAAHSITPETSGSTPLDAACAVNMIWIKGVADLCKK